MWEYLSYSVLANDSFVLFFSNTINLVRHVKRKTIEFYSQLIKKYPIKSIEDPFAEDDWESWKKLTKNTNIQIVGDDLFATNTKRLKKGIEEKSANAILVKLNQIGTVSETLNVINLAHKSGFKTIVSHRSGDSEDTFLSLIHI